MKFVEFLKCMFVVRKLNLVDGGSNNPSNMCSATTLRENMLIEVTIVFSIDRHVVSLKQ